MESKPNSENQIYTLVQSGTPKTDNVLQSVEVNGVGLDITDDDKLKKRAKRKIITNKMMLALIDVAKSKGDMGRVKQYWNTYHCQGKLLRSGEYVYGKFCKNKCCTVCTAIRKAELINKYRPVLVEWKDMYFVTLTIKACKEDKLKMLTNAMYKAIGRTLDRLKKRNQRGKGIKVMGVKSFECNFNPIAKTYNPHFHLIVPSKEVAELLIKEWLITWKPKDGKWRNFYNSQKGQDMRPANTLESDLVETIKYGSKIFTEPDQKKGKKASTNPMIYVNALDNIYAAMSRKRLFDRFGFSLPPQPKKESIRTIIYDSELFKYSTNDADWVNKKTGECLSGYINTPELEHLLNQCINLDLG
ncbi:MAG: protein rep [Vicingaceae bacterium]|nr:protein rep [Vicingaceae bacterium]